MNDAAVEFPFVQSLPKRERVQVRTAIDVLNEYRDAIRAHGALLPKAMVASVLNVSRQRVDQFIGDGRLSVVEFAGHPYVTDGSLRRLAQEERKIGRPFKVGGPVRKGLALAAYLEEETSK